MEIKVKNYLGIEETYLIEDDVIIIDNQKSAYWGKPHYSLMAIGSKGSKNIGYQNLGRGETKEECISEFICHRENGYNKVDKIYTSIVFVITTNTGPTDRFFKFNWYK
jgi:hypothetical protein